VTVLWPRPNADTAGKQVVHFRTMCQLLERTLNCRTVQNYVSM